MKYFTSLKPKLLLGIALGVLAAGICSTRVSMVYAGPPPAPEKPAESNALSGATLYAINCSRCHQERYATEFTAAQWKTIMIHMRVRANLPAAQAREIQKYMLDNAGN